MTGLCDSYVLGLPWVPLQSKLIWYGLLVVVKTIVNIRCQLVLRDIRKLLIDKILLKQTVLRTR